MNFSEIPQYPRSRYAVNVDLEYLQHHVDRYINTYNLTLNPEYQRDHVWTDEQASAYVEHLLRGATVGNNILINVKNWDKKNPGQAEVLDGKQRLTSLLRFLNNSLRAFGLYRKEFTGRCRAEIIWQVVDLNEIEVMEMYVQLNAGGTAHRPEEIQRVRDMIKAKKNAKSQNS